MAAALLACAMQAPAQDFMNMVDAYGQAHVNMLRGQIMSDATRRTAGASQRRPAGRAAWPRDVDERSIGQRVLGLDDLRAMRDSDEARMRRLLDGREVSVQGTVRFDGRSRQAFSLVAPGAEGYRVWAYWSRPPASLPRAGDTVRLRGRADMKRATSLNLAAPQILAPVALARVPAGHASTANAGRGNAADPRALKFAPSAAVTRDTNARLARTLSGAMVQGRSPDELRRLLDSGDLHRGFRDLIGKYGFSDRDLADVMAGHLVMSWQVVNDVAERDEARGNAAVRDGLREALSRADWVRGLDNAKKQAMAETLIVGTMLNVTRYVHGKRSGDARLVSAARQDADAMVRGVAGFDLRQVRLTSNGFERN